MELMEYLRLCLLDLLSCSSAKNSNKCARQSFINEKDVNDDDLPDFNELDRPPDEIEEESMDTEVEE